MARRMRYDTLEWKRKDERGQREAAHGVNVQRQDSAAPPKPKRHCRAARHLLDPDGHERAFNARIGLENYTGSDGWLTYLQRTHLTDPYWLPAEKQTAAIVRKLEEGRGLSATQQARSGTG